MTPSNPTNQQPFIYRIADAAGVFHLVAPVDHTHTYAEVPGLADDISEIWASLGEKANSEDVTEALAGKQNVLTFDSTPTSGSTNPVTSGGVKEAIDEHIPAAIEDEPETGKHASVYITPTGAIAAVTKVGFAIVIEQQSGDPKILEVSNTTIENFLRASQDPDTTPKTNSNKLITSGGVKAALGGKADTNHTHTPIEVQGVIPSFVEWTGQTLDLDTIIDGTLGMVRLMIYNNDSSDTTFGDLFESLESLPIHLNANVATAIETQHYALCTIYKMDKSQTPSEHDHDLCYFITLDGVFNDGNPSV